MDYKGGQAAQQHLLERSRRAVANSPKIARATLGKCGDKARRGEARGGVAGRGTANMCHEPFKLITGINLGRKNYALTLSGCHLQHELELVRRYEGGGAGQGRVYSSGSGRGGFGQICL